LQHGTHLQTVVCTVGALLAVPSGKAWNSLEMSVLFVEYCHLSFHKSSLLLNNYSRWYSIVVCNMNERKPVHIVCNMNERKPVHIKIHSI
jgi:hypothetical protein